MPGLENLTIQIDKRGCRGCGLCEKICPAQDKNEKILKIECDETEKRKIAKVDVVENCIACLSCVYICPSNAITLKNHHIVKNFYRDTDFSRKLNKFIGVTDNPPELKFDVGDHEESAKEVGFLLRILTETISETIGRAANIVSNIAGKEAAKKMPLYFESPRDLHTVIKGIENYLQGSFEITDEIQEQEKKITLHFERCALRKICQIENIPLGEDLCKHFHSYLNGMLQEHMEGKIFFEMNIERTGDRCSVLHASL